MLTLLVEDNVSEDITLFRGRTRFPLFDSSSSVRALRSAISFREFGSRKRGFDVFNWAQKAHPESGAEAEYPVQASG